MREKKGRKRETYCAAHSRFWTSHWTPVHTPKACHQGKCSSNLAACSGCAPHKSHLWFLIQENGRWKDTWPILSATSEASCARECAGKLPSLSGKPRNEIERIYLVMDPSVGEFGKKREIFFWLCFFPHTFFFFSFLSSILYDFWNLTLILMNLTWIKANRSTAIIKQMKTWYKLWHQF